MRARKEGEKPGGDVHQSGLTDLDRSWLLDRARSTVAEVAVGKERPNGLGHSGSEPISPIGDDKSPLSEDLRAIRSLFVTLQKQGELRGCMGTLSPDKPLWQAVVEVARNSALHDPRFPPVNAGELREIEVEITILGPMIKTQSPDDIIIGKHGLYLLSGAYHGLFLPQVASERGWSREQFLHQVCLKAGLPSDGWRHPDAELYLFEAEHFSSEPN